MAHTSCTCAIDNSHLFNQDHSNLHLCIGLVSVRDMLRHTRKIDHSPYSFVHREELNSSTVSITITKMIFPSFVYTVIALFLFVAAVITVKEKARQLSKSKNGDARFPSLSSSLSSSVIRGRSHTSTGTNTAAVVSNIESTSSSDGDASTGAVIVSVKFYGESQCPLCRKFVTEAWQPIWLDEGFRSVIDYDFVAWGNAYWPTKACQSGSSYNSKERACWYKQCMENNNSGDGDDYDDNDCFSGEPIYQHSTKEGIVDIYESCVKEDYGLENAVAFTYCAEGPIMDNDDLDAEHIMRVCTVSLAGVDSDHVEECYKTRGHDIEISNAKQTPSHPGVPYVLVDGEPVDDPMAVKDDICKRLKSKGATSLPDSCTTAAQKSETDVNQQ
jgi:Gamma interferon inducible lysosomal thiol reductase (GILT)